MHLYETIFKRKSVRKFDMAPLDKNTLKTITDQIHKLIPMYDTIKTEIKIVDQSSVNNLFAIKAPHYVMIFSENKEGYLTNAGFILQQMDLFLSASGIGSCWVGMAKPTKEMKNNTDLEFVIVLAIGKPKEPLYREDTSQFKRKALEEVCSATQYKEIFEAVRLAPSAVNSQPWHFTVEGENIHAYCIKSNLIKAVIYEKLNKVDMGIALCHLWIAAKHMGKSIEFLSNTSAQGSSPSGYYYITSMKASPFLG